MRHDCSCNLSRKVINMLSVLLLGRARIYVKTQLPASQSAEAALSALSLCKHFNFRGLCYYFGKGRMALGESSWLLSGLGTELLWREGPSADESLQSMIWPEAGGKQQLRGTQDNSMMTVVTLTSSVCNCLPFSGLLSYKIFRGHLKAILQMFTCSSFQENGWSGNKIRGVCGQWDNECWYH